jgi:hypothetical protein
MSDPALGRVVEVDQKDDDGTFKKIKVSLKDYDKRCGVCFYNFDEKDNYEELRKLPCNHAFHIPCITQWFEIDFKCPLCKAYQKN